MRPARSCSAGTPARVVRPTVRDWVLRRGPGRGRPGSLVVPDTTHKPDWTRGGAHGPFCIGDPYPSPPSRYAAFLEAAGGYLGRRSLSPLNRGVLGGNLCLGAGFRSGPQRKKRDGLARSRLAGQSSPGPREVAYRRPHPDTPTDSSETTSPRDATSPFVWLAVKSVSWRGCHCHPTRRVSLLLSVPVCGCSLRR